MKLHSNKQYLDMNNQILKINLGASRESQKQQGFFDGRFVSRTEQSKKTYTRKNKHKNKSHE
jgi:hypothetical protein